MPAKGMAAVSAADVQPEASANVATNADNASRCYTLYIQSPKGAEVSATYDGAPVVQGQEFVENEFDADLFSANEIDCHFWRVVVDRDKRTITIKYTKSKDEVNPAAIVALMKRIGGNDAARRFKFVLNPAMSSKAEKFVISSEKGKILIKGSTLSAITTGIGWYLNHIAHINIAWNSLNEKRLGEQYADLSNLPLPAEAETHICDAQYRYYLNYCTFGYSMTSWTWKRWQQEIDWMALHGINMPLQIVGMEEVWRRFLTMEEKGERKYNYSDADAKAFVAGPAYTAWWGMNNLEGWGGTASDGWGGVQDDAWYRRQAKLAKDICARQRELGMQPVLPGFSGMVPHDFAEKTGAQTFNNGGSWCGYVRPHIIYPTDARFADVARDYYTCLREVMGESHYYSMDPFHEGGSIDGYKYSEAYRAVYDAMDAAEPNSQWVIMQWQWTSNQRLSVGAVPMGKLIVLDLFSDGNPAFDWYEGYAPQHAVFCAIPNFGGRSGVMGRLHNLTNNYFRFKEKFASIKGIGAAPEAIEQTPVTYDLIFSLPWLNGKKPDVKDWINDYATSRYGTNNATAQQAWQLLGDGVLNYGADGIQGPVEDVWAARPNLDCAPASTWGVTINNAGKTYTPERRQMLIAAVSKLMSISDELNLAAGSLQESNYLYDIVEYGSGVMADYAYDLLKGIKSAKESAGENFAADATYQARRDAFLALIADVDAFKGTNLNFRLGKWTQEARDAAAEVDGATTATPDWYEHNNARTLITTWGDQKQSRELRDYSYRSWQGLLKDFYLPRWKYYFDNDCKNDCNYFFFEWNWAHGMTHRVGDSQKSTTRLAEGQAGYRYDRNPEGNTLQLAGLLYDKYIIPVELGNGTHYAYRHLDNDLTDKLTIAAKAGEKVNLASHFGLLKVAAIGGDCFDGVSADLKNIPVRDDAAAGKHTCVITLNDGTSIRFCVEI